MSIKLIEYKPLEPREDNARKRGEALILAAARILAGSQQGCNHVYQHSDLWSKELPFFRKKRKKSALILLGDWQNANWSIPTCSAREQKSVFVRTKYSCSWSTGQTALYLAQEFINILFAITSGAS
jgi:hypothetical protein